jgi:hypothetical protein
VAQVLFVAAALRRSRVILENATSSPDGSSDGGDHDVGPEEGAVLADPPAFVLEAPSARAIFSSCSGQPRATTFLRIEDGEVLADDLVGLVELQPLRARVPARDVPSGSSRKMA